MSYQAMYYTYTNRQFIRQAGFDPCVSAEYVRQAGNNCKANEIVVATSHGDESDIVAGDFAAVEAWRAAQNEVWERANAERLAAPRYSTSVPYESKNARAAAQARCKAHAQKLAAEHSASIKS